MGAQDFEPLRRSCGPTFVSPWLRRGSFRSVVDFPQNRKFHIGLSLAGPYIATGVPNMEPLLCVLTGGVRVEIHSRKKPEGGHLRAFVGYLNRGI